jgi:hypothetical protein
MFCTMPSFYSGRCRIAKLGGGLADGAIGPWFGRAGQRDGYDECDEEMRALQRDFDQPLAKSKGPLGTLQFRALCLADRAPVPFLNRFVTRPQRIMARPPGGSRSFVASRLVRLAS